MYFTFRAHLTRTHHISRAQLPQDDYWVPYASWGSEGSSKSGAGTHPDRIEKALPLERPGRKSRLHESPSCALAQLRTTVRGTALAERVTARAGRSFGCGTLAAQAAGGERRAG